MIQYYDFKINASIIAADMFMNMTPTLKYTTCRFLLSGPVKKKNTQVYTTLLQMKETQINL